MIHSQYSTLLIHPVGTKLLPYRILQKPTKTDRKGFMAIVPCFFNTLDIRHKKRDDENVASHGLRVIGVTFRGDTNRKPPINIDHLYTPSGGGGGI